MGKLKVEGNYIIHESGRSTKLHITHKTRNSRQLGDLTAVAKRIILKEHATHKNNLHKFLAEPKINIYQMSYSKANQTRSSRNLK